MVVAMRGKDSCHLEGGSSKISQESHHLRASHNSQDKTRKQRRELVSQTLSHQFGIVSLLQNSTYLYKIKAPLYIGIEDRS